MKQYLRQLPPVHELQRHEQFNEICAIGGVTDEQLTKFIREALFELREELLTNRYEGALSEADFTAAIFTAAKQKAADWTRVRLTRVINGTGTVLHTNLGRSRLSEEAVGRVVEVARGYSNLEYRIEEGVRGSRHDIIEDLLKEATGAEAAMVVNNNAAAVFLILSALAKDKEVIVSRGQLVEIGGSFRISSIMEESGARLVEVGTTNKTHLYDYELAIKEETAMILKVHTSNFKTIGFTKTVETDELAALKNQHDGLVFYEDLGSGALYDFRKHGIGDEPPVREVIETGVDVVSFSGDKLLGGPQAGLIAGRKDLISRLKKHQLARVLRVDKMTLAALEETLKLYLTGEDKLPNVPTVRDVMRTSDLIQEQAQAFRKQLLEQSGAYTVHLQEDTSQVGGGTMPGVELPTVIAAVTHERMSAQELAAKLRACTPAVISRIQDERVCIDFRTIEESEMHDLFNGFMAVGK